MLQLKDTEEKQESCIFDIFPLRENSLKEGYYHTILLNSGNQGTGKEDGGEIGPAAGGEYKHLKRSQCTVLL